MAITRSFRNSISPGKVGGQIGRAWTWVRYLGAIIVVAVALWLSLLLQNPFGNPFWFFFAIAVIFATWALGRGPGWLAVAFSTTAALYYFVPPYRSWQLNWKDVPFFLTFCLCQAGTNWLFVWRGNSEDALRRAHDELEVRVEERTAELRAANEALLHGMEEQRRAEDALQAARAELTRVSRITTVGELTASIAHEVNQPLAAIVANADACVAWLGHEQPNLDEARAAAERAVEGATRAAGVIKRIRSLIRKSSPERVHVPLNQLVEDTLALTAGQALRSRVEVRTELMPQLPDVLGDPIQLQQVILNLISNGMEAMAGAEEQERKLTIRSEVCDGSYVTIAVRDQGAGVGEEVKMRLFEPFFTTKVEGIGMGLAIARSIIEAHGGRLSVESNAGRGATFHFTLPSADGASI